MRRPSPDRRPDEPVRPGGPPDPRRSPGAELGLVDAVDRREAARLLGFASEFKVRQLEKQGRLRAVRGAMGQAWYARAQVLSLAAAHPPILPAQADGPWPGAGRPPSWRGDILAGDGSRWSDAALLAHLRRTREDDTGAGPTVVDLVVETGIGIARAQRIHRFWLAHDQHPAAARVRGARPSQRLAAPPAPRAPGAAVALDVGDPARSPPPASGERRGQMRRDRDALIRQLRDPDPGVRAQAFRKLRHLPSPPTKDAGRAPAKS